MSEIGKFQQYLNKYRKRNGDKLMPTTKERYSQFVKSHLEVLKAFEDLDDIVVYMNAELIKKKSPLLYYAFKVYLSYRGDDLDDKQGFHNKLKVLNNKRYQHTALKSVRYLESKVLSRQEVVKLIEKSEDVKLKCAMSFLYDTATRRSELLNMKFKDITFKDPSNPEDLEKIKKGGAAEVTVYGKGGKHRMVYLSLMSVKLLKELHGNEFDPESKIFQFYDKNGKLYEKQDHQLYKMVKAVNDKYLGRIITPHCFRHTRATHLADLGFSAFQLQSYLGHSSSQATQIYIDISPNTTRDAFNMFDTRLVTNKEVKI